jgi:hypothetical protein
MWWLAWPKRREGRDARLLDRNLKKAICSGEDTGPEIHWHQEHAAGNQDIRCDHGRALLCARADRVRVEERKLKVVVAVSGCAAVRESSLIGEGCGLSKGSAGRHQEEW